MGLIDCSVPVASGEMRGSRETILTLWLIRKLRQLNRSLICSASVYDLCLSNLTLRSCHGWRCLQVCQREDLRGQRLFLLWVTSVTDVFFLWDKLLHLWSLLANEYLFWPSTWEWPFFFSSLGACIFRPVTVNLLLTQKPLATNKERWTYVHWGLRLLSDLWSTS